MDMWKMLTQKFKAQSLDEVRPFQGLEVDDRDSGTESDEENAELQAIEEAMHLMSRDQENSEPGRRSTVLSRAGYQSPGLTGPSPAHTFPVIKRPFQLVSHNHHAVPFQPLSDNQLYLAGRGSPAGGPPMEPSSDYDCCSLDDLAADMDLCDRHSSEEELAGINKTSTAEKRKWSQMAGSTRCHSCHDSSGGSSSDDEVRDLLGQPKPLNFSSSPPQGVHRLSHATLAPKLFLANLSPNNIRLCSVSPRKRHRQTADVHDSALQRPCLDFEKMQKTLFRKHIPHGIAKARIVKIRLGLIKGPV